MTRAFALALLVAAFVVPLAHAGDPPSPPPGTVAPPSTTEQPPPTDQPPPTNQPPTLLIPDGVTIDELPVGGLTVDQARTVVETAFEQPLQLTWGGRAWGASPSVLGAKAYLDGALIRALAAPPGSAVELMVTVRGQAVRSYVDALARQFVRAPHDARVRLVKLKPVISEERAGIEVRRNAMVAAIVGALRNGDRGPFELFARQVPAKVTARSFKAIVVIRRGSHRLFLYKGEKSWRTFGVAVGQPAYPTPLGRFRVIQKQRNPWWYPPPDSPWAQGARPIPPGPGNPLGTRWMGLSAPLVGIHGTPDAASIGYSASHGCIRMLVPQAEWLFDHLTVGTPVFIVAQ